MASPSRRRTDAQRSKRAAVEAGVLDATEALLEEGAAYGELSVEQIATRGDLAAGLLASGAAEQLHDHSERWWSGEGDGAAELTAALAQVVALHRAHAPLLGAVVETAAGDPDVAAWWRALVGRFQEQAAGAVDPALPAGAVAFALCWMTERAAYEHLAQDGTWLGAGYGRSR